MEISRLLPGTLAALVMGAALSLPACVPAPSAATTGALAVRVSWPARTLLARADDVTTVMLSLAPRTTGFERAERLSAGMLRSGLDAYTFEDLPAGTYDLRAYAQGGDGVQELTGRRGTEDFGMTTVRDIVVAAGAVTSVPVALHLTPVVTQPVYLVPSPAVAP